MSQPVQVFSSNDPNNDWCAVDNGASQVVITVTGTPPIYSTETGIGADKSTLGMDNTLNGALDQGLNPFSDTGSVLLDSVNDTAPPDPRVATVVGNPISLTQPTYKVLTTVLNSALTGIRILYKNPA